MQTVVVAKNDDLLWIQKPAGLPVFPPHNTPEGDCVLARLQSEGVCEKAPAEPFPEGFEGGILHRLDVSTSGILLAVRSPHRFAEYRALFTEKALTKRYRFLTHRRVPWSEHRVDLPIAHDKRRKRRMVVQRGANTPHRGKWYPAETFFRHIEGGLWEAVIRTGVMHQIRVHAASCGLTLAGDPIYGSAKDALGGCPEGVDFCLHHVGLEGGELELQRLDPPGWWPQLA